MNSNLLTLQRCQKTLGLLKTQKSVFWRFLPISYISCCCYDVNDCCAIKLEKIGENPENR